MPLTPNVLWAQRVNCIYLTLDVQDVKGEAGSLLFCSCHRPASSAIHRDQAYWLDHPAARGASTSQRLQLLRRASCSSRLPALGIMVQAMPACKQWEAFRQQLLSSVTARQC